MEEEEAMGMPLLPLPLRRWRLNECGQEREFVLAPSACGTLVPPRVSDDVACILVACACCANGRAQRMRQEACRKQKRNGASNGKIEVLREARACRENEKKNHFFVLLSFFFFRVPSSALHTGARASLRLIPILAIRA